MNPLNELVCNALSDFGKVSSLARAEFSADVIAIEVTPKPHISPKILPIGKNGCLCIFP